MNNIVTKRLKSSGLAAATKIPRAQGIGADSPLKSTFSVLSCAIQQDDL